MARTGWLGVVADAAKGGGIRQSPVFGHPAQYGPIDAGLHIKKSRGPRTV